MESVPATTSEEVKQAIDALVKNIGLSFLAHLVPVEGQSPPIKSSAPMETTAMILRRRLKDVDEEIFALRVESQARTITSEYSKHHDMILTARGKVLEAKRLHIINVLVMLTCMAESIAVSMGLSSILANALQDCTEAYTIMKNILEKSNRRHDRRDRDLPGLMKDVVDRMEARVVNLLETHTSLNEI